MIERMKLSAGAAVRTACEKRRSIAARVRALRGAGENGQALVEMAVVAPVLLLITFGMCVFGIALNDQLVLTNAVQQGAQVLSISRGVTDPCATVATAVENAAPNIISGTSYSTTTCTAGASLMTSGANGSVQVTYPFSAGFILFGHQSYTLFAKTQEVIQ
jgi:Flp pilus assembly protein TadG